MIPLLIALLGAGEDVSPVVSEPPPYDAFLVIPLRVHILRSEEIAEIHCGLDDEDVRRIIGKVNRIWHPAGIHFGLESIVREPAENLERLRLVRELIESPRLPSRLFRDIRPEGTRDFDGLHVYYVHDFDVNGVYMGRDFAFVKETARLRDVEGGIDEPIPRVTSHELGHALGLPHREDRTNLLASGTTGTALNADEVERARNTARGIRGARDVAALRRAAEAADAEIARRLWTWLGEIPGDGAAEALKRREALDEKPPRDR
jgi:hypothetical protein